MKKLWILVLTSAALISVSIRNANAEDREWTGASIISHAKAGLFEKLFLRLLPAPAHSGLRANGSTAGSGLSLGALQIPNPKFDFAGRHRISQSDFGFRSS